ncbi:tetratricopeptide repeat-containing sensor histidine kinase [Moheibacter lacus]|uniref:Oxygen sensor histidine kinase NreB n=1 Tax=Moheibacter lacus TaxID=2745851 RepID=A0A838ZR80_9FLAO|nr:ATP-binding protein [Moheibacter lacus]MBA5628842.1 tetratricopeptide repeat protein [Moheibacter lacus]
MSQIKEGDIEYHYQKYRENVEVKPDSALLYLAKAKKLNQQLEDENWNARIAYGMGYTHYIKNDFRTAHDYFKQAIRYANVAQDFNVLSKAYNQIGQIYAVENDVKNALVNYHKSLKISEGKEELNDNTIAVLSNLADLYILQSDTLSARNYYHQAQKIGERDDERKHLDIVYNNLAVSYMKTNKDSTEFYLNKSLQIQKENHSIYGQIMSQLNLVSTYLNFKSKDDYQKSFEYLEESLKLSKAIGNLEAEFFSYFYFGKYYEQAESNLQQALFYYNQANEVLRKGFKNDYAIELYKSLSRVHSKLGNYKEAYGFEKTQHKLQDSIFSVEKNKQFHEAQTKFDVERKNNQIQLLNKEKQIQKGQNQLIFTGSFLAIISLLILAIFYRKRMKYQETISVQEKLIFEKEIETTRTKNLLEGQNLERKRIATELHDGVGGRLSAIKIKMDQLNTTSIKDPELEECINQLQETAKEIRVISHELNENNRDKINFVHLLLQLVKDYRFYFTGEIHLNIFPESKFQEIDGVAKHYLYRTIQEILSNCLKYAEAENINIDCTFDTMYRIIVDDDGKGFDVEKVKKGMGISNLYKRVQSLNGSLFIDSAIGRGSTFIIEIPQDGKGNS